MAIANKSSLQNMLSSILSVGNQEQSMIYPPSIYSAQYNTVSSLLLSQLVKRYPTSTTLVDMLNPFMVFLPIPVTNGYVQLPPDYRNLLGNPSVVLKADETEEEKVIPVTTEQQFKLALLKSQSSGVPLTIVDRSEWDYRVSSEYKKPTVKEPIGQRIGDNRIQVAPYDLTRVYVLYAKKENIYNFGYVMNPDDTYFYDPTTSIESEWDTSAFDPLFKGLMALYSAYVKDPELQNWTQILKNGIL